MVKPLKRKLQLKSLNAALQAKASLSPGNGLSDTTPLQEAVVKHREQLVSAYVSSKPVLSRSHRAPPKPQAIPISRVRATPYARPRKVQAPRLVYRSPSARETAVKLAHPALRKLRGRPVPAPAPRSVARLRERQLKRAKHLERQADFNYGDIQDLQRILGLGKRQPLDSDVTFLSLDLEWERKGLLEPITEIGITTLSVRDIVGLEAGPFATSWKEKMKHVHIVTDASSKPSARMGSSLFGKSAYMTGLSAKVELEKTVRSLIRPDTSDRVILVGQSVDSDIIQLEKDATFKLQLEPLIGPNFQIFDTHKLALEARKAGAEFQGNKRLASLALNIGIENTYRTRRAIKDREAVQEFLRYGSAPLVISDLKACHNASNDAAYAMITMLLFALRWSDFVANGTPRGRLAAKVWDKTGYVTSSETARRFIADLPADERAALGAVSEKVEEVRVEKKEAQKLYDYIRAEKRKMRQSWFGRLRSMFRRWF